MLEPCGGSQIRDGYAVDGGWVARRQWLVGGWHRNSRERNLVEFPKEGGNLFVGNRFRWLMAFKSLLTGCAGLGTPVPTVCPASWANSGGNGGRWTTKAGGLILETTNILFSYSKTLTPNIHPLCTGWAAAGRLHCAPVPSLCRCQAATTNRCEKCEEYYHSISWTTFKNPFLSLCTIAIEIGLALHLLLVKRETCSDSGA